MTFIATWLTCIATWISSLATNQTPMKLHTIDKMYQRGLHQLLQICLTLFLSTGLTSADNGYCREGSLQQTTGEAWVETQRPLSPGWVTGVTTVFCSLEPVTVQLWDRDSDTSANYRLVWSREVVPPGIGQVYNISFGERLYISSRESLGLSSSSSAGYISIMKEFDATLIQLMYSRDTQPFQTNRRYTFEDVLYPGTFLIEFCTEQGCPPLGLPPLPPPRPTDHSVSCDDKMSSNGRVKLEKLRPLRTGVARAIRTYFCHEDPVVIQLWAPDNSTAYTLLWQKLVAPVSEHGTEKIIVLEQSEYIDIKESYRLGLQNVYGGDIISVPFQFYPSGNLVESTDSGRVEKCTAAKFSGTAFPSKFMLDFCGEGSCQGGTGADPDAAVDDPPCPGMGGQDLSTPAGDTDYSTKDHQRPAAASTTSQTPDTTGRRHPNVGASTSGCGKHQQQWHSLVVILYLLPVVLSFCS